MVDTFKILEAVRREKPLVHHITNWVTIYDCANIVRTVGALPVMAHAREEAADMAGIASALVLNIGTLTSELVESMIAAGKAANEKKIPVVLDAVGAGATRMRDEKTAEILEKLHVDIIKGNSSEIARIVGMDVHTRGVESTEVGGDLKELARRLALREKSTVAITGKEDIVTDGSSLYACKNGHDMMGWIVGTGCMAASVMGAFAAVESDRAAACAAALTAFGIAGEIAAQKSSGPGTFKLNFYDSLHNLSGADIEKHQKTEKLS